MFRIIKLEPRIVLSGNNTPPHEVMKDPLPGNEIVIPIFEQFQGKTAPLSVTAGHETVYDVSRHIVDDDQDTIIYTLDSVGADWMKGAAFDGSFLKIPKPANSDAGNYEVHFSASDGHNDPAKFSIKLTVAANKPPYENKELHLPGPTNPLEIKAGNNDYDLSPYITDDDQDTLRYSLVTIKPLDTNAAADTNWFKDVVFEGTHLKINSTSIKADGYKNYAVNFTVKDDLNENVSFSLRVQIIPNLPPRENTSNLLPNTGSPLSIKVGSAGVYDLSSHITDNEKDTLTYSFVSDSANPDWLNKCSFDKDSGKLTIPAPSASDMDKPYQIHFTVSDSMNAPQNFSFSVKVAANTPPHENTSTPLPTSDSPLKLTVGQAFSYDLSSYITDDEKDTITYKLAKIEPSDAGTSIKWLSGAAFSGNSFLIPAPPDTVQDKLYKISFYADDKFSAGTSEPFSFTLKVLQNSPPYENPDKLLPGHGAAGLEVFKGSSPSLDLKQFFKDDNNDTLIFYPNSISPLDGGGTDWFIKNVAFDNKGVLKIPAPTNAEVGKHYIINFWMGDDVNPLQLYSIPLTIPNRAPTFPDGYSLQLSNGKATISATDSDGDTLIYSISGKEAQAFTINAKTGELILNNPDEFEAHQEFTPDVIAIEDKAGGLSAETQVKLTINSSPQGNAGNPKPSLLTFDSQQKFDYDLSQHYTDADHDSLKYSFSDTLIIVPFQSGVSWKPNISDNGQLTGTAPTGQSGDYIVRFNIDDGYGGKFSDSIEIRFRAENAAPIIHDATFSIKENSHVATIAGSVSASDSDGDKLSYSILPESDPNKIFSIHADTGMVRLEKPEFLHDNTVQAISLTVKADDHWLSSDKPSTATITVNIEHANTMPAAVKDPAVTDKKTSVLIDVLHNDSDPNGDALKIENFENTTGKGVITIENNQIHYTPGSTFQSLPEGETATDMFVYTVSDGKLESKAPVLIEIKGINTPPTASGVGIVSKIQDTENITPFSSFVLSDPDVYKDGKKDIQTMTIQIDKPANGNLVSSGGFKEDGGGHYTMTDTADKIQNDVRNIVFAPVPSNVPFVITETHFQAQIKNHPDIANLATISASSAIPVSEAYPAETVWNCRDMIVPFKGISYADTSSDILGLSIEYGLPIFRLQQFKLNDFDFGLKDETENVYEQINRMLREARLLAEIEEVNHADRNAETWRIDIHPIQIR